MTIRVLHVGVGPIGIAVARQVASRAGFDCAGAVDIDPVKAGKDVGDVISLGRKLSSMVWPDLALALDNVKPDVVALCTSSSLERVIPQLQVILGAGVPVVSTTEELAFPSPENRALVAKIDALARDKNVAVLGTGVNPGFVMDALPIMLTGPCESVEALRIDRIQDASIRRLPFQQKIGAGLTVEAFERLVASGRVRHVGLTESIYMIADAMKWRVDRVVDEVRPQIARTRVASQFISVDPGLVCGLVQDGIGYVGGKPLIKLHMEAYLGAPESYDQIEIDGSPPLKVKIIGGTHGDIATASIVVNSIPNLLAAAPGYRTMRDLPIPSFFRAPTTH
jgi:4-hydroxy-tetrahydrodipicolinate reductase